MKKWNNIIGFKSYLFTVSLVLFFLGTLVMTNNVLADDCISYSCTGITTRYGEVMKIFNTCVDLCAHDFEVNLYGIGFACHLYPINPRNLLGTASTMEDGWAGCSVERRGRTLITKLTLIQENEGLVVILQCKPCNDCCG